jgi:methionyl-tRNA synthetase
MLHLSRHANHNKLHPMLMGTQRMLSSSAAVQSGGMTKYITTPIFYVNGSPHLGHAYSGVLADALTRWHGVCGEEAVLMSGTDEHGTKVERAALAQSPPVDTQAFCDEVSAEFRSLFEELDVDYGMWMRTTDRERHWASAQALWRRLEDAGLIYLGEHSGWYCAADECFVPESQLVQVQGEEGAWTTEAGHAVEWVSETNYKFRLSQFSERLEAWVRQEPGPVQPPNMRAYVLSLLASEEAMSDISVSRPKQRLSWSVDVPGDPDHGIYVWLDALSVYLTGAGFPHQPEQSHADSESGSSVPPLWPASCQIIGKDIIKFHAVYWPAFLLGAGLALPERIVAHGHWTVGDGVKMSKSLGNVVDPRECMRAYGVDAFRYCLLREGSLAGDAVFGDDVMKKRLNTDLANKLGNLFKRITSPRIFKSGVYPRAEGGELVEADVALVASLDALAGQCDVHFRCANFQKGLAQVFDAVMEVNVYVQEQEPWVLAKSEAAEDAKRLRTVVFVVLEALRVTSILLQPAIPRTAGLCLDGLGVPASERLLSHCAVDLDGSLTSPGGVIDAAFFSKPLFHKV